MNFPHLPHVPESAKKLFDLHLFGKHQTAAFLATVVDFAVMIGLVRAAHLSPPVATVISAICGGVTNFAIGRAWAFQHRHSGSLRGQMGRYAAVSFGGALLNAGLLAALLWFLPILPYVAGRIVVSILVSVAYTYPMHAQVVFRALDVGTAPSAGASSVRAHTHAR